jgi:UDP-GlcNAc:undecaprenyl-phosphate GlcNAc-1-phosphate transferase
MGHSHFHAVLIFYAWTATVAVGCLLFLFVEWWWVVVFVSVGFTICAIATFAPLGRKRTEIAAQTAAGAARVAGAVVDASLDPLDRAAAVRDRPTRSPSGDPS